MSKISSNEHVRRKLMNYVTSDLCVNASDWYDGASNKDIKEMIELLKKAYPILIFDDLPIDFVDELLILLKNSKFTNEYAKNRLINHLKTVYGFNRG